MIKTGLKQGFTLAEVLTTLMVIGVVAAMTIPTLLNSTDDQQHKVALKKAVSVLSQAYQLNIAKEFEDNVTSSLTLCQYFANSMAGSCAAADGNNASKLTTPDGLAYYFYYRGTTSGEADKSFESTCGTTPPAPGDPHAWAGENARCVVIVDTNGSKSHNTSPVSLPEGVMTGVNPSGAAIGSAAYTQKDQYPLIVTSRGVYPAIGGTDDGNQSRGYKFLYGDSAVAPWGSAFNSKGTR